jgi:methylenetetrahydrofolate reductase (NADPH)
MPVTNLNQIERFASMSGAEFPVGLVARFEACADEADVKAVGVEVATELAQSLLRGGAPGIHLYTLNKSSASADILRNLKGQ